MMKNRTFLEIRTEPGTLYVSALAPNIIRVTQYCDGIEPYLDDLITGEASADNCVVATGSDSLTTEDIVVKYHEDGEHLTFHRQKDGACFLAESSQMAKGFTQSELYDRPIHHSAQWFRIGDDEAICGFGYHQNDAVNLKNQFVNLDQYNTVSAIPFFLSSRRYGVLWNTSSRTEVNRDRHRLRMEYRRHLKRWVSYFTPDETGGYSFDCEKTGPNAGRSVIDLAIDGNVVAYRDTIWQSNYVTGTAHLEAGKTYRIHSASTGAVHYRKPSQSNDLGFWTEVADRIEYYVVLGDSIDAVVAGYRRLTGKAPMFSKWMYGYWQSRERYQSPRELLDVVTTFREKGYPIDGIVQDWQYWGDLGWNALAFDERVFPEMTRVISELRRMNTHAMISIWPNFGVSDSSEVYKYFASHDYFIKPEDDLLDSFTSAGAFQGRVAPYYDVHNESAVKAYWDFVKKELLAAGVEAWWCDASEPNLFSSQGCYRAYSTCKGLAANYANAYPLLHSRGLYRNQRHDSEDHRVFILSRTGFAGIQAYGTAVWSGDTYVSWDQMKKQIACGITASASGLPYWTHDIGGFCGGESAPETRELMVRWFQFGAFTPIFRSHGTTFPREPWMFGDEAEGIMADYLRLRYRLMPYIYSVAWDVTKRDGTMMRSLLFDFPDEAVAHEINDQYMFGPWFMVCPVTDYQARTREVYLPSGTAWHDFWTGEKHEGGRSVTVKAPLSRMPLFVKAGAIVPIGPEVSFVEEKRWDELTINIYPGKDSEFVLYDDDGSSYAYETGEYHEIPIRWDDSRRRVTIGPGRGAFPSMPTRRLVRVAMGPHDSLGSGEGALTCMYDGSSQSIELN